MKKILPLCLVLLCLITGCSKETPLDPVDKDTDVDVTEKVEITGVVDDTAPFEVVDQNMDEFHEIRAAEKVDGGVLYYSGSKLLYDKNGTVIELADQVTSLWREKQDIYYNSDDVLYTYNFDTQEKKKLVDHPKTILGKYDGRIISYSGRNIYAIEGTKKTKIFADGYYLNEAILYKNKVYGIPATNVYEYNLDTLEVEKVTKQKHDMSSVFMVEDELYIGTVLYNEEDREKSEFTYYKVTDDGPVEDFKITDCYSAGIWKIVKDGMFGVSYIHDEDYESTGSQLFYVSNGELETIDRDYYYDILGICDNKLLYYKNTAYYYSEQDNLTTFYLYDGKESTKAFDLNIGYCEGISGYEYEDGILIEVSYESSSYLYKYDGKTIEKIDIPYYVFSFGPLEVIDGVLYVSYWDGEESFEKMSGVIPLADNGQFTN